MRRLLGAVVLAVLVIGQSALFGQVYGPQGSPYGYGQQPGYAPAQYGQPQHYSQPAQQPYSQQGYAGGYGQPQVAQPQH